MKKNERLLESIGEINDKYVSEAADTERAGERVSVKRTLTRAAAVAASVVIVAAAAYSVMRISRSAPGETPTVSGEATALPPSTEKNDLPYDELVKLPVNNGGAGDRMIFDSLDEYIAANEDSAFAFASGECVRRGFYLEYRYGVVHGFTEYELRLTDIGRTYGGFSMRTGDTVTVRDHSYCVMPEAEYEVLALFEENGFEFGFDGDVSVLYDRSSGETVENAVCAISFRDGASYRVLVNTCVSVLSPMEAGREYSFIISENEAGICLSYSHPTNGTADYGFEVGSDVVAVADEVYAIMSGRKK